MAAKDKTAKFTACLVHENDKDRIKDMRTKLNLTEKDTMTMIIDYAENHIDEMIEQAAEKNRLAEEAKEARRKEKAEDFKLAQKEARKLVAAGKVKKTDTTDDADQDDEPSID
jgi:hypothetical protein